jgi:hypothetical protein
MSVQCFLGLTSPPPTTFSTEKTDGMFATLIVVLPSQFAGGDAHVSHAGDKLVFNTSRESLINTSVLAWYTDVMHEIVRPVSFLYTPLKFVYWGY